jgi:cell pole-organizing protein PopZ
MLEPVPSVPPPAAAPPPPVKRAAPPPEPEPAFETKPVAVPEPPPRPAGDRLVSGAAAAASIAAMSQLTAPPARPAPTGSVALGDASRTLEDLVRELLRPMLKDWLDAQLPKIVERLVQEEIQRMSREAQGR